MAFPTSIPSNTDPTSGNTLNSPSHSQLHQSHNAEIVAVETKIGTGASTPIASRLLRGTGTGTSAWSQLALSTDVASATSADLRGVLSDETGTGAAVFGTSPVLTTPAVITSINDSNGNEVIKTPATASAVNEITVTNAATTTNPSISATGGDTNISLNLIPKGTGNIKKASNNIDWWEELGRTTLGSTGDTISVAVFTAHKYLFLCISAPTSGQTNLLLRFNNDSAANYASRFSNSGAADTTVASDTVLTLLSADTSDKYATVNIINITAKEKIIVGQGGSSNSAGAANVPSKYEFTGKWANTSNQITRIDVINTGSGDFAIGSELVVLGHD